jgi:hypothetical protein
MGYNTTVVINNDRLTDIINDRHFGAKMYAAIAEVALGEPTQIRGGYGTAVETHHADHHILVQVGNCSGSVVGARLNWMRLDELYGPDTEAAKEEFLRSLANELGFRIVRKPKRKS